MLRGTRGREQREERAAPPPEELWQAFQVDPRVVPEIVSRMFTVPDTGERSPWVELEHVIPEVEREVVESTWRLYSALASARKSYGTMIVSTVDRRTLATSVKLLLLNDLAQLDNYVQSIDSQIARVLETLRGGGLGPEELSRLLARCLKLTLSLLMYHIPLLRLLKETDSAISLNMPFQAKSDLARNMLGYTAVG